MLESFKSYNIIKFTHKGTSSEKFDNIHKIILDSISDHMYSLIQTGNYGATNTASTKTMGYYYIKYVSDTFTLK